MIQIDAYVRENGLADKVRLLMQVHDELVYEIAEGEIDVAHKIRELMEGIIKPADIEGITLTASASAGKDWGSVEAL
jgi:DNA polymerase-1